MNEKKSDGGWWNFVHYPWTMPRKRMTIVIVELKGRKVSCEELIRLVVHIHAYIHTYIKYIHTCMCLALCICFLPRAHFRYLSLPRDCVASCCVRQTGAMAESRWRASLLLFLLASILLLQFFTVVTGVVHFSLPLFLVCFVHLLKYSLRGSF